VCVSILHSHWYDCSTYRAPHELPLPEPLVRRSVDETLIRMAIAYAITPQKVKVDDAEGGLTAAHSAALLSDSSRAQAAALRSARIRAAALASRDGSGLAMRSHSRAPVREQREWGITGEQRNGFKLRIASGRTYPEPGGGVTRGNEGEVERRRRVLEDEQRREREMAQVVDRVLEHAWIDVMGEPHEKQKLNEWRAADTEAKEREMEQRQLQQDQLLQQQQQQQLRLQVESYDGYDNESKDHSPSRTRALPMLSSSTTNSNDDDEQAVMVWCHNPFLLHQNI
jgi:hypothetical protein